ncbi:transporter substrate-binding domain-containing protein [Chitinimonas viridis]|uniref:Transporter substrate-binding domain-containing protein n=1 Tax=Chitinimonas viridis TaxID=664880 RepID=A0ABT8B0W7_9NEIS|nr:transporter substrate-binding domain-containing protein [Chitinimonas viridis]MDN3575872.1 transporter substrate-binding domain-containing protein [Chitinimonas viridis]
MLKVPSQSGTEPKYLTLPDGSIGGICIDVLRAIERLEPTIRFSGDQELQPAARIEASMAAGSIDAECGLSKTPEREARFIYAEPALFQVRYHLVARADDATSIQHWDDVRKLGDSGIILTIHGFGPVSRLRALGGLQIDSNAKDTPTNLQKLLAGRGRFFYHRLPGIKGDIRKLGLEGKVRILPTVMDRQAFYLTFARHVPPAVIDRIKAALRQLEQTGDLKRLADKWDDN